MLKRNCVLMMLCALWLAGCRESPPPYSKGIELDGRTAIVARQPILDTVGLKGAYYAYTYNDKNQLTEVNYLVDGAPAVDPYFLVAKITVTYEDDIETRSYFDTKGKPCRYYLGVYSNKIKLEKGNRIGLFNYDAQENIIEDYMGVGQYKWEVNGKGYKTRSLRFDKSGKQISDNQGYYDLRYTYDDKGNIIEKSNHGVSGQLLAAKDGIAVIKSKYDANGNETEADYYGVDGRLKEKADLGYAKAVREYDGNGDLAKEQFYDRNGKPVTVGRYMLFGKKK